MRVWIAAAGSATLLVVSRTEYLSDAQWALIEPLLPSVGEQGGRPFRSNRRVVEGIVYRYRVGVPWRDVPVELHEPADRYDKFALTCRAGVLLSAVCTWLRFLAR